MRLATRYPTLMKRGKAEMKPPRQRGGDTSARYTGVAWPEKPSPRPSSILPTMSMAMLAAAALTRAPAKNRPPPISMTACRPSRRVTRLASSVPTMPNAYSDDVKAVSAWLL
uniref:Uncharacterized protein n=1 Tax=Zea mays TaxID=4577 RepID=C0HGY7_MAIZE|nr:unknown [Zea mays]